MAVGNTFFIPGHGPPQHSYQRDHQEVAGLGVGYGPLQSSHQGDHQEITGYGAGCGPIQHSPYLSLPFCIYPTENIQMGFFPKQKKNMDND